MVAISVSELTIAKQLKFYLPLAITALLTLTTHSLFNAGLARLSSPEVYISAFAVSKSLMHMFESPIMMTRQTVAALVDNVQSFNKVKSYMIKVVSLVVLIFSIIALSGLGQWILRNIMGLRGETLEASVVVLRVFIVFPFVATFRNFVQGTLIKLQATPLLTIATIIRIIYVTIMVASVSRLTMIPDAILTGLMFLSAISVEALFLWIGSKLVVGNSIYKLQKLAKNNPSENLQDLTYRLIFNFNGPLMITSFIKTLSMPIINIGLARTSSPEIAISAYAVAWGLGMIVLSPLVMFHQVPLNFVDESNPNRIIAVKKFAVILGLFLSLSFVILSFTGLGYFVLTNIIGASEQVSVLAMDVLKVMSILPIIVVAREFYWGYLMKKRVTKYLSNGKAVNVVVLMVVIWIMSFVSPANPALIGIVGKVSCDAAEFLYLFWSTKKHSAKQLVSEQYAT